MDAKLSQMKTPLLNIRKKHNQTLRQVADVVGLDPSNLSRIERGLQTATPQIAERLSEFFENKISEIEILYPHRYPHPDDGLPDAMRSTANERAA
jgi:putative transcriptional regulator